MRKLTVTTLTALLSISLLPSLKAQDTTYGWRHALVASVNLAQVSFSHWAPGGTDAFSYVAMLNGKSEKNEPMTNWATSYKLAFGQTKLNGQEIRKGDDEINLESMLTYKIGVHINPYAAVSLRTQFATGYEYPDSGGRIAVSGLFDPAYVMQSAGMGWKPSAIFQTRLGVALREIFTNHYPQYAAEPLEPGSSHASRVQGGAESVSELALPVDDNVLFRAKLDLFSPFKTMDRMVMHGETSLIAKVSKVFSAELAAVFVNDPDLSPFTQIKQGLSIGISYAIL
ncbi:MAG: DUF3078 domain-containing protein [Bacteroidota bacterium]|nr:DUF3078 domain-containing protein [Bacteroidota bacterium]MDP4232720.1 DUF3078 domain-containing protein [Bacteroidota bacterium]MDP4243147.1 DUF3078 domain-containing protein [Bacteroidota bacterium]MDP4287604.1 DUF3078 domain-containing protein [Bacteroidota bacterium]